MTFWETFDNLCRKANRKPHPLGKELGIASATITQWKNGSIPSGDKLVKIADYFDCSVDYLLGREQKFSSSDLSDNEQKIVDIFKNLEPIQQGEIIGRAQLMAEQNKQHTKTATRPVFIAARSSDNHGAQIVDMPVEMLQRLREAPETDDEDL